MGRLDTWTEEDQIFYQKIVFPVYEKLDLKLRYTITNHFKEIMEQRDQHDLGYAPGIAMQQAMAMEGVAVGDPPISQYDEIMEAQEAMERIAS